MYFKVKVNKRGQIIIPKAAGSEIGLVPGVSVKGCSHTDAFGRMEFLVVPAVRCHHCGRILTDEFEKMNACPGCPPPIITKIY